MQKKLETLAYSGPLKLKRDTVSEKQVTVQAQVDLDTGVVQLVVSDRDLQRLRQDAHQSCR
ncbi:hypothetical protein FC99_GL000314 [Levilactobacillus koreensis JCM 16448]|uniref:Uncharacterized protein n=1 Tax=Levilactobacillus koreensis TaxID=637971 RepID=A0AAC8UUA8_9LACO|nr:hypothetical protein [Levilactobacillus koreensis]AKP64091.1 hypothetical protein ABN16_03135 [Levilactobacillus koreensis]KRK89697.1 hypothetical protein FC99_GL000314 [Levilactobacillus koreensis JCM 16448]